MDISAHPKLDPKLKETYDRIMGITVGSSPQHSPANTPENKAAPAPHPVLQAAKTSHPTGHLSHLAYSAGSAKPEHKEKTSHVPGKTNELLLPIILGASGVVFFVVYSIFWVNFFGM